MFKLLLVVIGIMVLTAGTVEAKSVLGSAKNLVKKIEAKKIAPKKIKKIDQKICPVMGGRINTSLYYTYKGRKIYVCCGGCIPVIKKNPEKYLKKVQKDIEITKKKAKAALDAAKKKALLKGKLLKK